MSGHSHFYVAASFARATPFLLIARMLTSHVLLVPVVLLTAHAPTRDNKSDVAGLILPSSTNFKDLDPHYPVQDFRINVLAILGGFQLHLTSPHYKYGMFRNLALKRKICIRFR